MAEYVYPEKQTVQPGKNFILIDSVRCTKGILWHNNGSGIVTIRARSSNPCAQFSRFLVFVTSNIAVSEGQTPGAISIGLAVNGEIDQTSVAIVTPTVAEAFFNASVATYLTVANGCCTSLAIENNSDIPIDGENTKIVIVPAN